MKAIAVFILFIGMFLVVQGYYKQSTSCPVPKVEIKYIPHSLYEEQLSGKDNIQRQFKSLFEDITDPWNLQKTPTISS
jgi:hypothetical protein